MNGEKRGTFPQADQVATLMQKDDVELIGWLTKGADDSRARIAQAVLDHRSRELLRQYTDETGKIARRTWWAAAGACAAALFSLLSVLLATCGQP